MQNLSLPPGTSYLRYATDVGGLFATMLSLWGAFFLHVGGIFLGLPPPSSTNISAGAHVYTQYSGYFLCYLGYYVICPVGSLFKMANNTVLPGG